MLKQIMDNTNRIRALHKRNGDKDMDPNKTYHPRRKVSLWHRMEDMNDKNYHLLDTWDLSAVVQPFTNLKWSSKTQEITKWMKNHMGKVHRYLSFTHWKEPISDTIFSCTLAPIKILNSMLTHEVYGRNIFFSVQSWRRKTSIHWWMTPPWSYTFIYFVLYVLLLYESSLTSLIGCC